MIAAWSHKTYRWLLSQFHQDQVPGWFRVWHLLLVSVQRVAPLIVLPYLMFLGGQIAGVSQGDSIKAGIFGGLLRCLFVFLEWVGPYRWSISSLISQRLVHREVTRQNGGVEPERETRSFSSPTIGTIEITIQSLNWWD